MTDDAYRKGKILGLKTAENMVLKRAVIAMQNKNLMLGKQLESVAKEIDKEIKHLESEAIRQWQ